jgi:RNA polymerase sigma-70 factor (ECF subfamily)
MNQASGTRSRNFPATAWTIIRGAQGSKADVRRAALERLIQVYWRPVYWQLRRDWNSPHWEAADLTQEYFAALLSEAPLQQVSPERGSFRAYVKATLRNFVLNARRREKAMVRGGAESVIPLSELEAIEDQPYGTEDSPERAFDRELMRSIVRRVLEDLRSDCERRNKPQQYELFHAFYSGEQAGRRPSYARLQQQFGLGPHDVKNLLADMRVRFRKRILDHLRDGISGEEELVNEIREVFGS